MSDRSISESVQRLSGTQSKDDVTFIQVLVTGVDVYNRLCSGTNIGGKAVTSILNIQLLANDSDGQLLIPSVGSIIGVIYSLITQPMAVMFSDLDEYVLVAGGSSIDVKAGLIQLNDGSLGGLVQVAALTKKLNNAETAITQLTASLKVLYALLGATPPPINVIINTVRTDIENTKINHGV